MPRLNIAISAELHAWLTTVAKLEELDMADIARKCMRDAMRASPVHGLTPQQQADDDLLDRMMAESAAKQAAPAAVVEDIDDDYEGGPAASDPIGREMWKDRGRPPIATWIDPRTGMTYNPYIPRE